MIGAAQIHSIGQAACVLVFALAIMAALYFWGKK